MWSALADLREDLRKEIVVDFAERMTLFDEIMRSIIIIWEEERCKIGKNLLIYELVRSLGETSRLYALLCKALGKWKS